ncbi:hypothetical protein FHG87_010324 [Trinorchestia longiramus]|nr:hypothetical protein FHG87_010324 [Trinorchestia longiramus]
MSQPSSPSLAVVPPEEYQQFADALREFRPHSYQVSGGPVPHSYQVSGGPVPHSYQVEAMLRSHLKYDYLGILRASLYAPARAVDRHHLAIISPSGSTNERCMFTIYWNDNHLSDDAVYQLLKYLPVDSWHQPIMIRQMPSHLRPKMDAILLKLSEGDLHLFAPIPVHVYSLDPEDTPPVPELPDGYYYGSLNGNHGTEILSRWPEAPTETFECFKKYLDTLPSAAVFRKMDLTNASESHEWNKKHDDELVSYTVYKPGTDIARSTGPTANRKSLRRRQAEQALGPVLATVSVGGSPVRQHRPE